MSNFLNKWLSSVPIGVSGKTPTEFSNWVQNLLLCLSSNLWSTFLRKLWLSENRLKVEVWLDHLTESFRSPWGQTVWLCIYVQGEGTKSLSIGEPVQGPDTALVLPCTEHQDFSRRALTIMSPQESWRFPTPRAGSLCYIVKKIVAIVMLACKLPKPLHTLYLPQ